VLSASYNETDGEIIEVSEEVGLVAVKINKKQIKYIEISKIYEITEKTWIIIIRRMKIHNADITSFFIKTEV